MRRGYPQELSSQKQQNFHHLRPLQGADRPLPLLYKGQLQQQEDKKQKQGNIIKQIQIYNELTIAEIGL